MGVFVGNKRFPAPIREIVPSNQLHGVYIRSLLVNRGFLEFLDFFLFFLDKVLLMFIFYVDFTDSYLSRPNISTNQIEFFHFTKS